MKRGRSQPATGWSRQQEMLAAQSLERGGPGVAKRSPPELRGPGVWRGPPPGQANPGGAKMREATRGIPQSRLSEADPEFRSDLLVGDLPDLAEPREGRRRASLRE